MADDSPACASPLKKGPNKGLPATGTTAGALRHWRAGESPCDPCREAQRVTLVQRYRNDPEYWRVYRREESRRRYAKNPEPMREATRRWTAANREKVRRYQRQWQKDNPDKKAEKSRKRRARQANALTIPFNSDQLVARMAYWGNCCWMCGGPFEEVDHVIAIALGGPHCLSNLRPACKSCNSAKRDLSLDELGALNAH